MGPMSVRVASCFPFNVTCFLNGHSFLARELTRMGVGFRKDDNALLAVADVAALEAAAERLTPALIEPRCAHWVRRLAPRFSRDRSRRGEETGACPPEDDASHQEGEG